MRTLKFLRPQERAAQFPGIRRLFFNSDAVQRDEPYDALTVGNAFDAPRMVDEAEANLVGSQTDIAGIHLPVLDLDFPARLVPSTTPDHYHLYLDLPMTWDEYTHFLRALQGAGVLEPGYVEASLAKGGTFVRKPGVQKPVAQRFFVGDTVEVVHNRPEAMHVPLGRRGVVTGVRRDGADVRLDGNTSSLFFTFEEIALSSRARDLVYF